MKILRSARAMARLAASWELPVALVPTMGALHAGHLSLIAEARRAVGPKGWVAVSIFVNPLQFGPAEDLSRYPRPLRKDLTLCRKSGVDLVFLPEAAEMYAPGQSVVVNETLLSAGLCGQSRPGHFSGVCTVVAKLFNLVRPDIAVFGQKDYQQLAIIRRMVRDLNFPVRVIAVETVREADGLALSSRNAYLRPDERAQAPALRRALLLAAKQVQAGLREMEPLRAAILGELAGAPLARTDYVEIVDEETLQPIDRLQKPTLLALAVFFGRTRLIDNLVVKPSARRSRR